MNKTDFERLDYLDKAKGILIMLMVSAHVFAYGYFSSVVYSFHMPAFFVISGILLNYTNACDRNYKNFVLKRLFSFGIPFIAYEATGPITDIILNGVTLNYKGYIYNTLSLSLNNKNMWFLISLFCVEVLFVGLYKIIKSDKIVIALAVVFLVLGYIIPTINSYVGQFKLPLRYFIYFTIGFYFGKYFIKTNTVAIIVSTLIVFILAAILGINDNKSIDNKTLLYIICALCGSYAIIQLGKLNLGQKGNGLLSFVGRNTMIIYGTHHLYYIAIGALLGVKNYNTTPVATGIAILLIVAILEIPTIYIINHWLPFLAGKHYKREVKTV